MKNFILSLLKLIMRILLILIWGCCRFAELFFAQVNKWLKELINNPRIL